jgi:tetratricopeptide (TPR) repeat protein
MCVTALREPSIKESRDEWIIRIDSSTDFVRLYSSSPLLLDSAGNRLFAGPILSALQYKEAGNRHYQNQRWIEAFESYSFALELGDGSLSTSVLSNRAATALKMGRPAAALSDCQVALLDQLSEDRLRKKLLFRASTCHYDLGHFEQALMQLDILLALDGSEPAAMILRTKCKNRMKEETTGNYDWPTLFAQSALALDISEFVDSRVVVTSIPGKGRGLVASGDVKMGELLVVAKPLAISGGDKSRLSYNIGLNLYTETIDPYAFTDLIATMIEKANYDRDYYEQVMDLHVHVDITSGSPPKSMNASISPSIISVDPSRFEASATFNAFHAESISSTISTHSKDDQDHIHSPSALYSIPSRMNHSCIGNISYIFLADVLVLRAKSDVMAGEELVDSYVDSLEEYDVRNEKLSGHRFRCNCQLCHWDRVDGEVNRAKRKGLAGDVSEWTEKIHGQHFKPDGSTVNAILALIDRIDLTYSKERPIETPRSALYHAYRLLAQLTGDYGQPRAAIEIELKALGMLGGRFNRERGDVEVYRMMELPVVGGINAVLSTLFIARQFHLLSQTGLSKYVLFPSNPSERIMILMCIVLTRTWIAFARRIESGQSGVELFESRYSEWASRNGLDLSL